MKDLLKFPWQPRLKKPTLVMGWNTDASQVGGRVTDYLIDTLHAECFCEVEPSAFFPLIGIAVEANLVQFPECKFYGSQKENLIIFQSDPPLSDWYQFLTLVLGVAGEYGAREVYVLGGMVSLGAHTTPRDIVTTSSSPEMKETLTRQGLRTGMDYETPPGQRPTLNSFMLWQAQRCNVSAASLWVTIPFYLLSSFDYRGEKQLLEFFDRKLDLKLDFSELDANLASQNKILADLRIHSPEFDGYITRLETNQPLTEEENQKVIQEVEQALKPPAT
jgi:proteasome assembly chaperone (PAC2) family protein